MSTSQAEKPSLRNGALVMPEGIRKAKLLTPSALSLSPSDTIICSSPKSGATWLKSLAFAIVTRNKLDISSKHHPLRSSLSHELIPVIEYDFSHDRIPRDPDLPLLATHLQFSGLPEAVLESGCKIVYIWRDPKDVFVSYWHFVRKFPIEEAQSISLEQAFENFCGEVGTLYYGNYWDHVLGYWKAKLDCPERVMFLKYEDMMEDAVFWVKKLAEFVGYPFCREEEEGGANVVASIVEMCSFDALSKLEINKTGKYQDFLPNYVFFRKARVGDWSNYLTSEMADKLDQITIQKLSDSGLV